MELTEIEAQADALLERLADPTGAADVRDIVFRLDGLYRGAQIKAMLPESIDQGQCGFKWKWGQVGDQHFEICTLGAGHGGTHHLNQVTGINKSKFPRCTCVWATRQAMSESNTMAGSHHDDTCPLYLRNFAESPAKPVADRLHELVSFAKACEENASSQAEDDPYNQGLRQAYGVMAEQLEALLMEGGI